MYSNDCRAFIWSRPATGQPAIRNSGHIILWPRLRHYHGNMRVLCIARPHIIPTIFLPSREATWQAGAAERALRLLNSTKPKLWYVIEGGVFEGVHCTSMKTVVYYYNNLSKNQNRIYSNTAGIHSVYEWWSVRQKSHLNKYNTYSNPIY